VSLAHELRTGREIAEDFASKQITNPLLLAKRALKDVP
jgi:hypothetical protein